MGFPYANASGLSSCSLPKVRDGVAVLAVNPNTVLKAYCELETKGLTEGRAGRSARPGHLYRCDA